ncbi:hypothetical protein KHS38_12090 [Mucilaginibacter sp. Bleaf8]|uniref:hypothetical protein n=1 Tax=Mucilaginibacter sp. Bleaf8 TaxID=2834430 RepID=UPI001BCF5BB7|nr:hypothetical protein [Mucilaginibacter sp. Bleaf8]MBS7565145.1 hypothetical protein [Mucilaginibacter sp. Bleaf8]
MNDFSFLDLCEIALGLLFLYVYLKQAANVSKIRKTLDEQRIKDAWANYFVNLTANKKTEARDYLTYVMFYELHQHIDSPTLLREKYEELEQKYTATFAVLGYPFPKNPYLRDE